VINEKPFNFFLLLLSMTNKFFKFDFLLFYSHCRFKLTTIKFAVIVNRAAQESIYRVYACHQAQRHNQLPRWDSTPNSRGRNRRAFATVMVSLLTHKGTVFHLVQLVVIRRRAAKPWSNHISQFQWPHQVSLRVFFPPRKLGETFSMTTIKFNHVFN
jgi:hypothetical protein